MLMSVMMKLEEDCHYSVLTMKWSPVQYVVGPQPRSQGGLEPRSVNAVNQPENVLNGPAWPGRVLTDFSYSGTGGLEVHS